MKFVAWYCYKCQQLFRELEINEKKQCPNCKMSLLPHPVDSDKLELSIIACRNYKMKGGLD